MPNERDMTGALVSRRKEFSGRLKDYQEQQLLGRGEKAFSSKAAGCKERTMARDVWSYMIYALLLAMFCSQLIVLIFSERI